MTAPAHTSPRRYRFDDLTLDVDQRRLWRGAETVALSKLTFNLLRVLVEAAPRLVTHDELAEKVWGPRRIVTPENLSQRLMMLRHALGDQAEHARYIEGVRGQGYRLIPEVERWDDAMLEDSELTGDVAPTSDEPSSVRPAANAAPLTWRKLSYLVVGLLVLAVTTGLLVLNRQSSSVLPNSVAVIPFANLSPSAEDGYFALGMHEEIINQLVKLNELTVISRTTMMQYGDGSRTPRQVADELNVATVMVGSVRRAGDTVRVTVQLIDPTTDSNLWSETYNGDMGDVANIFAIQANIATNVAGALEAQLSLQEQSRLARVPTTSGEAYGYYLAGIAADQASSPEASERALNELHRAIEIDRNFALAWATLSYTLSVAPTWQPERTQEYQDEASQAALEALELEPDLVEAHIALSFASTVRGDWFRSEEEYRRALELGATRQKMPERGNLELAVGHIEQARTTFETSRAVNPLNSPGLAFYLAANEIVGDRNAVRDAYDQGRIFLGTWPFGEYLMNFVRLGRRELDELADDSVTAPRFRADFADFESADAALPAVRSWYEGLTNATHNEHTLVAAWAAYYGDTDLALAAAAGSTRTRVHNIWFLWLPLFNEVRRDPGFKELVTELGLVDYWREYGWPSFCRPVADEFECF